MHGINTLKRALEHLVGNSVTNIDRQILYSALRSGEIVINSGNKADNDKNKNDFIITSGSGKTIFSCQGEKTKTIQNTANSLSPSRVHQLPTDLPDFIGREHEIEKVTERLLNTTGKHVPVSVVSGISGTGKTALAVRVSHRLAKHYPDAQIFVDMGGTSDLPLTETEVISKIIQTFQPEFGLPKNLEELEKTYRNTLRNKRVIIVLDNAAEPDQISRFLPPPPCALLVTSRRPIEISHFQSINLDILPEHDARHFLQSILNINQKRLGELDAVIGLCGYFPLSLRTAATFLMLHPNWTVGKYIKELANKREDLRKSKRNNLDIEAVLELSVMEMARENTEIAAHWQMLSVFPSTFDWRAAAAVWSTEVDDTFSCLNKLLKWNLLIYDTENMRYRLHDSMSIVAKDIFTREKNKIGTAVEEHRQNGIKKLFKKWVGRTSVEKVDQQAKLEEAAIRYAEYYESLTRRADTLYLRGGEAFKRGLELFDMEWMNIQAGQLWAKINADSNDAAAKLCNNYSIAGADLLNFRNDPQRWISWLNAALASAKRLNQHRGEGSALNNLGLANYLLGEFNRAIEYYKEALAVARKNSDHHNEANALNHLGVTYRLIGEPQCAIEYYKQALAIYREIGSYKSEGNTLSNIGNTYRSLDDYYTAIEFYEQQLTVTRNINDLRGECNALSNLGNVYIVLRKPHRAMECYEKALTIARKIGDRASEGESLGNSGIAHRLLGEHHRAIKLHEEHLAITRQINDRHGESSALSNLGNAYIALGNPMRAVEYHKKALDIDHEIGNFQGEGRNFGNLGNAYADIGDFSRAIIFYEQAATNFREADNLQYEGRAHWNISVLFDKIGDRTQAVAHASSALEIYEYIRHPKANDVAKQLKEWQQQ